MSVEELEAVGQSNAHLCSEADGETFGARMHRDVVSPFLELRTAGRLEGIEIAVLSGFRSFERQLSIWNRKATGALPVLDSFGSAIDISTLSERDLAFAILRWSALPGASRHHWGTDLDVYDRAATPVGYEVELIPTEVDGDGMHAPMHAWLDARISSGDAHGFYRPYDVDRGGVAPERWHMSYAPLAAEFAQRLTPQLLRETIECADMRLKDVVLGALDEIYARFVVNTNPLSP